MNNKKNSKGSNNSITILPNRAGGLITLDVIPGDIRLIINKYVGDRPRKMRGINIDIFVSDISFRQLIELKDLANKNKKFWIEKTITTIAHEKPSEYSALYYLNYTEDFLDKSLNYGKLDSFIVELTENAFCLVSNFRRGHHNKVSNNLGLLVFPNATRAFLTSTQMYQIMKAANKSGYDLRVRSTYQQRTRGQRRRSGLEYESSSSVLNLSTVDEIHQEKKNLRAYLSMYKIIAANPKNPLEITFSGNGHIGLYEGDFECIYNDFIKQVARISSKRIAEFSKRSMSETEDKRSKPLRLHFDSKPFSSIKGIELLLKHIHDYHHINYSTIYSGNPHLFLYITDKLDYSTFSVRTYNDDTIIISPQIKTSAASMARFTNHLLLSLKDGEIETGEDFAS